VGVPDARAFARSRAEDGVTSSLGPLPVVDEPARPFFRWVGGKTQLLPELLERAPKRFGRYYEPFAGGAALLFALAADDAFTTVARDPSSVELVTWADLNDANPWITTAYKAVRSQPENVIDVLRAMQDRYREDGKAYYYDIRANMDADASLAQKAAVFIFLNKTNYNGLWRVNRAGGYNVPHGKRKTPPVICDEDTIRRVSRVLQHVSITTGDYELSVKGAAESDFVYFDSPYVPASSTSDFTAYTKAPFGFDEQERLRDCALALKARGVKVMLSNADVPFVRKLYNYGFKIERVEARRSVNSKGDRRGKVAEVIIT
jgi:DNA adenine methylase